MKKGKILFVKHYSSSAKFILNDLEILRSRYETALYDARIKNNLSSVFSFIHQFLYLLFNSRKFSLVYIWFADYHSFLPVLFARILGKKSVISVGGYDATFIPEINMGLFTKSSFKKKLRCLCAEYSLRNCSLIIPVDKSLIENENRYIYSDMPSKPVLKDGIMNFVADIRTPMKVIALGYDKDIFKMKPELLKESAVVSAGFIMNENEYRRKGFDMLVEAAVRIPAVKFILIGLNDEFMNRLASMEIPNIELYGKVNYEKLIELYSRAKVYSQLSMFEGMPSAVCEAMLCECIPVGSDVNGIPDIIGDCGIVVKEKDTGLIVHALNTALNMPGEFGIKSRERIIQKFSIEKRKSELLETVSRLM